MIAKEKLPALLKVSEVAEILRITKHDAYDLLKEGGIKYIKLSERRTRIPRDEFLSWLERQ